MEKVSVLLQKISNIVWGPWSLGLLLGTGAYLMFKMRFLPIRNLGYALKCVVGLDKTGQVKKNKPKAAKEGAISPFSALMTELATTIGIGNIVGVASAMVLGGPGALVWMILSSFLGLSTKFAESMLAVKYRSKNELGEFTGGPMYTLKNGFPLKKLGNALASLFAIFAVFASLGMGNMTQANSIAISVEQTFGIPSAKTGLMVTIAVIVVVFDLRHSSCCSGRRSGSLRFATGHQVDQRPCVST